MDLKSVLLLVVILGCTPCRGIFGGKEASIEDFPHHVAIEYAKSYLCAGAIISATRVLTVGHCLMDLSIDDLAVRAGTDALEGADGRVHRAKVALIHREFIRHTMTHRFFKNSKSEREAMRHDIALIEVAEPFRFDARCQPVKMFDQDEEIAEGTEARVPGWGLTSYDRYEMTPRLRYIELPVMSRTECNGAYEEDGGIGEGQICARTEDGRDSCSGDSGGGLVVGGRLAGLVSLGMQVCGLARYPGIYIEIAHFRDWIKERALV